MASGPAFSALRDTIQDAHTKDGFVGIPRDTGMADPDQDAPHAHAAGARFAAPAPLASGASSLADGLPEPLGTAELSPVPPGRRGRDGGAVAAVAAAVGRAGSVAGSLPGGVAAQQRHLALLGPSRPAPTKIWKRRFVKLLVVGDSGLGKTTLISSLLNTAQEIVQVHDGTGTSMSEFRRDPESLVTTISWKDEEAREVWMVRVQDTPGYGDWDNIQEHIDMVKDYVEHQNRRWLGMESAKDRVLDMNEFDDPRIDVCIYCLPPHRLRPNDVRYMSQLGELVPVVPVVLKADTMTISEAQRFRQEVAAKLSNPDTRGVRGRINTFFFSPQSVERAGLDPGSPACAYPFVVISSNDVNQAMLRGDQPVFWPQRAYKWGTAEAFNSAHSDLLALRALLLSEGLEEMVAAKKQRYEEWRRAALRVPLARRLRRRTLKLAFATLLPAAAVAFAAAHEFDPRRMTDTARRARDEFLGRARGGAGGAAAAPVVVSYSEGGARGKGRRRGWGKGGGRGQEEEAATDAGFDAAAAPDAPAPAAAVEEARPEAAPKKRGWW